MRNFIASAIYITLLLMPQALIAQEADDTRPKGQDPITITSSALMADRKSGTAMFEGTVVAVSGPVTLKANKMKVTYATNGTVTFIEAEGAVKLIKDTQVVTSDSALFDATARSLVFSGSPKAVDGVNVVSGTKMLYYIDQDRFVIEQSKVVLEPQRPNP